MRSTGTGLTTLARRDKFRTRCLRQRLLCLSVCLLLLTATPSEARLRCSGGLVDRGDSAALVQRYCGEPDHIEQWSGRAPAAPGAVWFYDRGPSKLLRLLRFRAQRLVAIDSDGYGFAAPGSGRDCRPGSIARGWSAYRVLVQCGTPDERTVIGHIVTPRSTEQAHQPAFAGQRLVYRERWRFDFGPRAHQREITLDNAIVTLIRTLDRGD